jgi:hypothetical protein
MRLIYLAGPYSHTEEEVMKERRDGFMKALAFFANSTENLCLYSPIVHWSAVAFEYDLRHDANFWHQQNFHMIKLSTAMWILPMDGWRKSYGLSQEMEYAESIGRETLFVADADGGFILTDTYPSHN